MRTTRAVIVTTRLLMSRILILTSAFFAVACAGAEEVPESQRLAEALRLEPGMVIADVGAGDGDWTIKLLEYVGEDGFVYATEVDEDDVDEMRQRFEDNTNVEVLLGTATDSGLPAGCCDAILLRMVYHHFTEPEEMRSSLHAALRPGGRLAVVEISPQASWRELEDVPDRGGHGIPLEGLIREMTSDCSFEAVERHLTWAGDEEDRYCVVFER